MNNECMPMRLHFVSPNLVADPSLRVRSHYQLEGRALPAWHQLSESGWDIRSLSRFL